MIVESISLVRNPAGIALPPVTFLDGDVRHGGDYTWPGNLVPTFLRNSIRACRGGTRSAGAPITIAERLKVDRLIDGGLLVDGELVPTATRHRDTPGGIEYGRRRLDHERRRTTPTVESTQVDPDAIP